MLSTVLLILCVASIVVAQMFILRSSLVTTARALEEAHLPKPRRAAEVAWAVLPAIALGVVLWMTWQEARAVQSTPPEMHHHHGHGAPAS